MKPLFIGEQDFRVWLPEVDFCAKSNDEDFDSRQMNGIMSTQRKDRQGETVFAKGLEFDEFLHNGHFNDNHSQDTSAVVGYPQAVQFHHSLEKATDGRVKTPGWTCSGYVIKGTKRADGIWELAQALKSIPNKRLGFSIEGKVLRRSDKTIEKAKIRNVAITNCPVNTDCTWDVLAKSFEEPDMAIKAMSAGYGASPSTQTGGGALRGESLESDVKDTNDSDKKKKKRAEALMRAIINDDMFKAMDIVLERRPDFDEDAAALFVKHLFLNGGKL